MTKRLIFHRFPDVEQDKWMRYLSVCSGIEAATVAWHPLGWSPFAFSEIEAFPSAVLAHHYGSNLPGEAWSRNAPPNLGDMTRFKEWPDADIDVLVGGTPCQSFSVAGLRKGLVDPRGNLALVYLAIADRYRPEWLIWENVPGVLSVDGGRAFGSIIGGMVELGYSPSWRVLDAQYIRVHGFARAVPQRRRRVFVVGHLGDWRRSAAVLFERESLSGNPPPRREAGQGAAPTLSARTKGGGGLGTDFDCDGGLVARPILAGGHSNNPLDENLVAFDTTQITSKANRSKPQPGDPCHPLAAGAHPPAIAFDWRASSSRSMNPDVIADTLSGRYDRAVAFDMRGREGGSQFEGPHETANIRAASGGSSRSYVAESWAVRRLLPIECERLQGFDDNYTLVPYRGKLAADGPRYKACGNSMAVNAMRHLGTRIELINALAKAA